MSANFWAGYVVKLAILALALAALYLIGRKLRRTSFFTPDDRHLRVLESTVLLPHVGLYLVAVGKRHFLIGAGSAGVTVLAELASAELETRG